MPHPSYMSFHQFRESLNIARIRKFFSVIDISPIIIIPDVIYRKYALLFSPLQSNWRGAWWVNAHKGSLFQFFLDLFNPVFVAIRYFKFCNSLFDMSLFPVDVMHDCGSSKILEPTLFQQKYMTKP
jgi:hypothetical protein